MFYLKAVLKDYVPSNKKNAMIHFEYNKRDIRRTQVGKIWDETCQLLEMISEIVAWQYSA